MMISGIDLFFALFNNLAIFIALITVYGYLLSQFKKSRLQQRHLVLGLSFGVFAIGCMFAKIPVFNGVIVDQRNAIIALCGAFGGPLAAFISAAIAGAFRIYLGGDGVFAGVVGVFLAAISGVLLNKFPRPFTSLRSAAFSGIFATLVILPGFLFVKDLETGWQLLQEMALPYGLAIFLGIFFVGLLLNREENRFQAELAFHESERRYRELVEGTDDLISTTDEKGCLSFVNQVAEAIWGLSAKDCITLSAFQFIHPEDRVMTREWFNKCVSQKKQSDKIENRQINVVTGEVHNVLWTSAFHYDDSGNFIGAAGIGRDITLRKQSEEARRLLEIQLQQSQKMDAIGKLSGGIAHDFNNILATILGYAELATKTIPEENPAKKRINEVVKAGTRAKNIVMQILAFSRKTELKNEPIQVHQLIDETVGFIRATIPSSIKIQTNVSPEAGYFLADSTQIQQVLMNLCTNSSHAMENTGGHLSINACAAELKAEDLVRGADQKPGAYVQLTVEDTGAGINPEHLERIFEPYFTTKETGKGSGMGLAVVHGIVNKHNGMVKIASTLGKGTKVDLFFPKIELIEESKVAESEPSPTGNEMVLVVDDELTVAEVTKERIENLGYQGTIMTSSLQALELFRSDPAKYDLVITDQAMPDMTGEQLAKEILTIRPDIPIIMCTGYSSTIDTEKAKSLGVKSFLLKPVDGNDLASTIRSVLDETHMTAGQ